MNAVKKCLLSLEMEKDKIFPNAKNQIEDILEKVLTLVTRLFTAQFG